MAIISCPECNKGISDKAICCPSCGCLVTADTAKKINCGDCGQPVMNGSYSCTNCGCPIKSMSTANVLTNKMLCNAFTRNMLIGSMLGLVSGIIYVIVFIKYSTTIFVFTMLISAQSTKSIIRLDKRCSLKTAMISYLCGIIIGIIYCTHSEWFTSILFKKKILHMY